MARAPNPDMIWVKDLGFGISRGMMELGRMFQGQYVPPARCEYAMKEREVVNEEPVMMDTLEVE